MTEDEFWAMVADARGGAEELDQGELDRLSARVRDLTDSALVGYLREFSAAPRRAYT